MSKVSIRLFAVLALAVAVGLATAVSPCASSSPDGLERVADDKAFLDEGKLHPSRRTRRSPTTPFRGSRTSAWRPASAGFVGALGVFALGSGLAFLIRRRHAGDRGSPPRRRRADACSAVRRMGGLCTTRSS